MNVPKQQEDGILAEATIHHAGSDRVINGMGNGRLDAVSNAIKHYFDIDYELAFYEEHSMTKGSSSKAVAYDSQIKAAGESAMMPISSKLL